MNHSQVVELIRRRIKKAGSQRALAQELGVSHEYLSLVLHGRAEVGRGLADALGLEKQSIFVRKR